MSIGKGTAEGIALLSLYNDEGDDEDVEEEDEEGEETRKESDVLIQTIQREEGVESHVFEEKSTLEETVMDTFCTDVSVKTAEGALTDTETLFPTLSAQATFSPEKMDAIMHSPVADRTEILPHPIFVDYDQDEGVLSPDAEEGEIMTTGRAVLASQVQISNGFARGVTSPTLIRQENKSPEKASPQPGAEVAQPLITTITSNEDSVDQEMIDIEISDGALELDQLADFLPPQPPNTKCSQKLQEKFQKFLAYKNAGRSFNEELRKSKGYRNPDFLEHAVKHQEIDQIGSCFRKEVFDPHGYDPKDFYDALALEYKREQERKEKAKKHSQRADFVHGIQTAAVSGLPEKAKPMLPLPSEQKASFLSQGPVAASEAALKSDTSRSNKKSKWDKVEADIKVSSLMSNTAAKSAIAALSAHPALLTTNAGGYASLMLQRRKDIEERSRGTEGK
ncbi:hypothetical protein KP509_04G051700 [Ceratopteris richardii]|uniref:Uncharacterized protein n=1 Tax=Ceratopteris richardii TaxID=49495 RepID=A0A8T2UWX8_CERRI|nr:hypothetical protein KP509_04G051700 [Ceratopteris richardii]